MASIRAIMKETWVIPRELSLKEKELLFITAEAAGMAIFPVSRQHKSGVAFPFVARDEKDIFLTSQPSHVFDHEFSYEDVMETLQKYIKEQSNKMWNEYKH
jgi:hypothetical protein